MHGRRDFLKLLGLGGATAAFATRGAGATLAADQQQVTHTQPHDANGLLGITFEMCRKSQKQPEELADAWCRKYHAEVTGPTYRTVMQNCWLIPIWLPGQKEPKEGDVLPLVGLLTHRKVAECLESPELWKTGGPW